MTQLNLIADVNEFTEETRVDAPSNFLIRIESFSLLTKYGINKYESRSFDSGDYKWKLIMNFKENKSKDEDDHISAYISIVESDFLAQGWEVNAIFTFFIHNQLLDTYHCFRGTTRRFNAVNPKWGLSKLISKKYLIDPSNGYTVDDNCVFGAEVYVIKRTQRVNECLSLIKDAYSYKRDWKISNFSSLQDIWKSEEFFAGDHKWKVWLYPKGNGLRVKKDLFISIYIECVDSEKLGPHKRVRAAGFIRIKSKLNDTHHSKKFDYNWFTSSSRYWGLGEFIPINDMKGRGFLVDDCCLLDVEITVQALALDAPQT